MTVAELIAILQTHDPRAVVVMPLCSDDKDDYMAIEMKPDAIDVVQLREHLVKRAWFDADHGARYFKRADDGDVPGVSIA